MQGPDWGVAAHLAVESGPSVCIEAPYHGETHEPVEAKRTNAAAPCEDRLPGWFTRIINALCGQPDLLEHSRSQALRELLAREWHD